MKYHPVRLPEELVFMLAIEKKIIQGLYYKTLQVACSVQD